MIKDHVVGLDPSLTGTGLAIFDIRQRAFLYWTTLHTLPWKGGLPHYDQHERLEEIVSSIELFASRARLVVVEGVFMGLANKRVAMQLAGLHYVIRHALWRAGLAFAIVAPNQRAEFATGSGRAGKREVRDGLAVLYPQFAETKDDNQTDAAVLALMGCHHLGTPKAQLPDTHLRAMGNIDWPTV